MLGIKPRVGLGGIGVSGLGAFLHANEVPSCILIWYRFTTLIDHFTVVGKVTWPLTGSEAGVDLVLIQTSLLLLCKSSCSHAN